MNIEQLFFELIRVAIGTQNTLSRPPSRNEWTELYAVAKKQSLVGICFSAVQKLTQPPEPRTQNLDKVQYLTWMGMAVKIQQRNEVVNLQCKEIYQRLINDGIDSCVLKGQGVAALYGALSNLRQSGDIDIFTRLNDVQSIDYAKKFEKQSLDFSYKHVHLNVLEDTEVDMHYRLGLNRNLIANRKLQKWCERLKDSSFTFNETLGFSMLSRPDNVVFTLFHIYEHLMAYGVGLRQVIDMYFVLNDIGDDKECREQVVRLIKNLGLIKFTSALMWVLSEVLYLPESLLLCPIDKKEGQFLLNEIMQAGNFGHHDSRNNISVKSGMAGAAERIIHYLRLVRHYPVEVCWIPIGTLYLKYWKWRKVNMMP